MPLYDATNRLTADACAVRLRDRGNAGVACYTLTSLRAPLPADSTVFVQNHPLAAAADNRNLRAWDGFGLNTAAVDSDTRLRLDAQMTSSRSRVQLPKRVFTASPALAAGQPAPLLEARLQQGGQSRLPCFGGAAVAAAAGGMRDPAPGPLAEVDWARFDPGVRAVCARNVIPPWTAGGAPSRDIVRSPGFLAGLGFQYDGRAWVRPAASAPAAGSEHFT